MIDLGLPQPSASAFVLDPVVKREWLWMGDKPTAGCLLLERKNEQLSYRTDNQWLDIDLPLGSTQSMLGEYADPKTVPELIILRDAIRNWRFYDHMRTDAAAPARQPTIGTFTPVLNGDGSDLAAALQTIVEVGDCQLLSKTLSDAFPGSQIVIDVQATLFRIGLQQTGMLRPLWAAELSDGTLRFLLLVAALLTPRPPELMVLNEPETSLHPDLLPALGRLIEAYGTRQQIMVITHSPQLIAHLKELAATQHFQLEKNFGQTEITNVGQFDLPPWKWPKR
jgi:predicted ATPase